MNITINDMRMLLAIGTTIVAILLIAVTIIEKRISEFKNRKIIKTREEGEQHYENN